ncbi:hypothetical protein ES288_D05G236800v1 [Gossypium darwinii]|uniref:Uncharacterized protein n=2 Tax=Gossypium TaxID=3633 RepID=A0A5D2KZL2_GOSTO|nr:hypothetical protein ES288_D05G236800v1 [Gossypium darwinii]TYH72162.1 hypothetical protein ES332_D05G235600v1 [Gossypium tomentosum]
MHSRVSQRKRPKFKTKTAKLKRSHKNQMIESFLISTPKKQRRVYFIYVMSKLGNDHEVIPMASTHVFVSFKGRVLVLRKYVLIGSRNQMTRPVVDEYFNRSKEFG